MSLKTTAGLLQIVLLFAGVSRILFADEVENPPVPPVCGAQDPVLASTCLFMMNGAGLPTSARTDFQENWDEQGYVPLTLAEHELLHAIGFAAVAYPRFANMLIATPGAGANGIPAGSRSFSSNGMASGIVMTLTPDGNHADPAATGMAPWPATGYNEANDIMQPTLGMGVQRSISAQDARVLDLAFGWQGSGIQIALNNIGGSMSSNDIAILSTAIRDVNQFFPANANSPIFTWSVAEVTPEPAAIGLAACGLLVLFVALLRSRRNQV
jgi:hypothetical protein